ncbi:MAG: uroporphyrinogen-III synthase [Terricaulis sp.]
MSLRVAVTRAQPEADATAARLRAMVAEPVLAPLLHIAPRTFDTNLAGVQALLFSSSNGVRAYGHASAARDIIAMSVGDATAAAARDAGFADVRSADGDVAALAALARATLNPGGGKLVHISGAHAAGDLAGALKGAGFEAERRVAYEAQAVTALPPALEAPIDIVLFHSARAAETYIALGAPHAHRRITACLSPAIAEAAARVNWARLIVAPRPREEALLEAALGG